MRLGIVSLLAILCFTLAVSKLGAQDTEEELTKNVNEVAQFWISTNNVFRLSDKWSVLNDIHIRRTDFIQNPNFYFIRFGGQYNIQPNLRVAGGYAHLWLTTVDSWIAYQNENRIYQQLSVSQKFPRLNAFFRLRVEQRFFNNVFEGESLNDNFFVNRVRLLISLGFPLKPGGRTEFLFADEIHLNFGKEIVYNTFNQNRLTLGFRYKLSDNWKVDFGYMMVFQQLSSGIDYNLNHTLRLFFYGNFDFRKDKSRKVEEIRHGEE